MKLEKYLELSARELELQQEIVELGDLLVLESGNTPESLVARMRIIKDLHQKSKELDQIQEEKQK